MPLTLSNLVSNKASAAVDFGNGNVLNVEYLPAAISGAMLSGLTGLSHPDQLSEEAAAAALSSVTASLLALLYSWDLVDDSDATLTIDEPTLNSLGLMNEWTIFNGIMAAQGSAGKSSAPTANGTLSR